MVERSFIAEDGASERSPESPPRPGWLVGVVGFVVGLGLGLLAGPSSSPPTSITSALSTPTTLDESDDPAPGVAEAIPGFPDAIVAVARTSSSAMEHLLWPIGGEVRVRPMTGGETAALDAGSQFIALTETVPGLDGLVLSMGRFNSIRSVSAGVTGHAWHDSTGGRLAFTRQEGESTRVYEVRADLRLDLVFERPSPMVGPVGWGDWGWAFQSEDGVVLFTPEGEFKDIEPGMALDTDGDGWVLAVAGGEVKLVSAGGGVKVIQEDLQVGTVAAASFSPDRRRVAVTGSRGLAVYDIASEAVTKLSEIWSPHIAWSSDGRFVLLGTSSGVTVYEATGGGAYPVLREHSLIAVGVVPLRSS